MNLVRYAFRLHIESTMWRAIIFIGLSAFMSLVTPSYCVQTERAQSPLDIVRPIKRLPVETPKTAEIAFERFEFTVISGGRHPGAFPIEGEPSKGYQYFVEATLYGIEAIATAKFDIIDEHGALIAPAPIRRQTPPGGGSVFYGVVTVPDRPFRVTVSGEATDGERYQRTYERLFKPTDRRQVHPIISDAPPADARKMRKFVEDALKKQLEETIEELKKSGGWIVMPRTRVFNVNCQPLLSPAGRPRGLRITYDVEFSETGYYNPELHVFPDYRDAEWRGKVQMKVMDSSIKPMPEEADSTQIRPSPLAYDAGYVYLGRTTYHFLADVVPDYVIQNEAKTRFCLWTQQYAHNPPNVRATYQAILSSKAPTTYRVYIANSDFDAVVEDFYGLGVFYNTFAVEGAGDCGPQPTNRF